MHLVQLNTSKNLSLLSSTIGIVNYLDIVLQQIYKPYSLEVQKKPAAHEC